MTILDDTDGGSIDASLFGESAVTPAPEADLKSGVHPRIAFNAEQWEKILNMYAKNYHTPNSWSGHQSYRSLIRGATSPFVIRMAQLDTSLYKGGEEDLSKWTDVQRRTLQPLADEMVSTIDIDAQALFMCAFWALVNDKMEESDKFVEGNVIPRCISASVSWAKVLITHRVFNCASACPSGFGAKRAYLWNHEQRFVVSSDSYTIGFSLALAYDVLYHRYTDAEKRTIRSAIALLVLKKETWGTTVESNSKSPNAAIHPHRIFSNWAPYHGALFLTNLAIEGETDFDVYTQSILTAEGETGFNKGLNYRFSKMMEAFMTHSIYADGSTFEDGYTYFISMHPGSLSLIAMTRRGTDVINTPRFRNHIHNAVQMTEPWHCGSLMGHGSGGGILFPTYVAFFRYVYPKGILPVMFWRNRMGNDFMDNNPCRIDWYQHMMFFTIMAAEHDESVTSAISASEFPKTEQDKLPLSFFSPRRGLVIMRNDWKEESAYIHFDARPDAFIVGHDNADRGVFTFSAMRQTWLTDLPKWNVNLDSRKHSLMHVDGLAQGVFKAPSVRMIGTSDDGKVAIAAANLTYAYNVHWYQAPQVGPVRRKSISYFPNGTETTFDAVWEDFEEGDPRSFGWPSGDDGSDLGMTQPEFRFSGFTDFGFNGLFIWKRDYRPKEKYLKRAIRSVALVRSTEMPGYILVADSFESSEEGKHDFESYLILDDAVTVDQSASHCTAAKCILKLKTKDGSKAAELHAMSRAEVPLSYRVECFTTDALHKRIVIKAVAEQSIELWLGVNAHPQVGLSKFEMREGTYKSPSLAVAYNGEEKLFKLSTKTFAMQETSATPRMAPIVPRRQRAMTKIRVRDFSENKATFLHPTSLTHQAVLQLHAKKKGRVSTEFKFVHRMSLCTKRSVKLVASSFALYYCGKQPTINYLNGLCRRVFPDESSVTCPVEGSGNGPTGLFKGSSLLPGETYFVAISVTPQNVKRAKVGFHYTRLMRVFLT